MKDLTGILSINKPATWSSRDVVNRVIGVARKATGAKRIKAGHAGTLDPIATGVLVVCLGKATRLIEMIQQGKKRYEATFLLGRTSPTDDIESEPTINESGSPPPRETIEDALKNFIGRIAQIPPAHSAVHVDGKRAYELARAGKAVSLTPREVDVFAINVLQYEFPELRVDITCGSGTYIRSIARDLGKSLGCGALMSALHRSAVGAFSNECAHDLEELTFENIRDRVSPPLVAVSDLPRYCCSDEERTLLINGRRLRSVSSVGGSPVAVLSSENELVAIADYRRSDRSLAPRLVFATR